MQIKGTMRYQYTLIRMAKIQTQIPPNAGGDVEQQELSTAVGMQNNTGTSVRLFGNFL